MEIIRKVALAVFEDKKMLQVRTFKQPEVFYTLGGKPDPGESYKTALVREVKEEIGCKLIKSSIRFLKEFRGVANDKDAILKLRMYTGRIIGTPVATSEVEEIGYFNTLSKENNLSEIARNAIFPWLKEHGYIN